jgi:hypothetical protein
MFALSSTLHAKHGHISYSYGVRRYSNDGDAGIALVVSTTIAFSASSLIQQ